MTRLGILSDIHGNLPALDAVLDDMAQFDVEHVIVAGDVINWGPFSREVLERLAPLAPAMIRGNNEFYLLDHRTPRAPVAWNDTVQWPLLAWLARQLQGRWQTIIAAWPDALSLRFPDASPLRVVHGSPRSPWEPLYADTEPDLGEHMMEHMMDGVDEEIVIAGHTHLAMDCTIAGRRVLNPGSVGVPLEGVIEACYMVLDATPSGWEPMLRRVKFDLEPLLAAFRREHFVDECGVIGHLVIDEFVTARLQVLPFLTWRRIHYPESQISMGLLDAFRSIDPEPYMPPPYRASHQASR